MLPEDPVLRGRLLRAARMLVNWSLPRLAAQAGVSGLDAGAVETGHGGEPALTAARLAAVLEWAGVRFLGEGEGHGPGLRYARPRERDRHYPEDITAFRTPSQSADNNRSPTGPAAAAERCLVRQRAIVARLAAQGADVRTATALLGTMERSADLLNRCRSVAPEPGRQSEDRFTLAA
jgi:hypothetical protein